MTPQVKIAFLHCLYQVLPPLNTADLQVCLGVVGLGPSSICWHGDG